MSTSSNIHINIGSLQNLLNSPPQGSEERKNALIASIFGDLSHRPNLTEFNTEEQNFLRNLYSNVIEQESDLNKTARACSALFTPIITNLSKINRKIEKLLQEYGNTISLQGSEGDLKRMQNLFSAMSIALEGSQNPKQIVAFATFLE
jgi:hypothetical protein